MSLLQAKAPRAMRAQRLVVMAVVRICDAFCVLLQNIAVDGVDMSHIISFSYAG